MKERQYQTDAVKQLLKLLPKHQRVCAVAPTGSGKTVIASMLMRKLKGKRVLWVAHRIELLRQAHDQLIAAGIPETELGILSGPDKINEKARILVASVAMFGQRLVPHVDVIVVDEAHRIEAKSYQEIIFARPEAWVIGFTATPWRLDGKGLGDTFNEMLVMASPTQMIVDGFVAQPICYGVPVDKMREILKGVRTAKRDFVGNELGKAMNRRALMGDIVKDWEKRGKGKATIVYAVNREHGRALLKRFADAGYAFEYLDGDTVDDVRAAMLKRLAKGEIEGIANVDVLVEGVDVPRVKCIVMARPTKSLTRFMQQAGRASRPWGNQRPVILDHAGNCHRFGAPNIERPWSLEGRAEGAGDGESPLKDCRECEALIPIGARECPECHAEQPVSEIELSEQKAELERLAMVQAQRDAAAGVVRALAKQRGLDEKWIRDALLEMSA